MTNRARTFHCPFSKGIKFPIINLAVFCLMSAVPVYGDSQKPKGHAPWVGNNLKGTICIGKPQGYGPYDYLVRKQLPYEIKIVQDHHFTPQVQALVKGQEGSLPADIDYTLRAWPNHHVALDSMIRYASQSRNEGPLLTPAECYLQRAIHFNPKDPIPILLYGIYLHRLGLKEKALEQYRAAEKMSPSNPELHYNMGLLLVGMNKYDEAKQHAKKAYAAHYPLPGLKNQLKRKGYWKDK